MHVRNFIPRSAVPFATASLLLFLGARAQEPLPSAPPPTKAEGLALIERVVANQKSNDRALDLYERLERREIRKGSAASPPEIKIARVVPAGTGAAHLPVGPDGAVADPVAYREQLEKLERSLVWASEDGRSQREAYEKVARRQKERDLLIDATRDAFLYSFLDRELRGDRMLLKYHIEPNPKYKPTSRATAVFSKVQGYVWIDPVAGQLARVEGTVTEDVSVAGLLAKVYKGSFFMQERYEMAPGLWFPSYAQYDFDGRRFFSTFAIHEKTFYSQYRRVGPPSEALVAIRAELAKPQIPANADP